MRGNLRWISPDLRGSYITCQRLPNGDLLLADEFGELTKLDQEGRLLGKIKLAPFTRLHNAVQLQDGRILARSGLGVAEIMGETGQVRHELQIGLREEAPFPTYGR
jgi:hypothetical protein